jgi:hypothetical protein
MRLSRLKGCGLITISSLVLVLTACPTNTSSPTDGPPIYSKIGLVELLGSSGFPRAFTASFYKLSTAITQPTTVLKPPEDSCVIDKTLYNNVLKPGADARNTSALDAGTELTVTNSSATLSTLAASGPGSTSQTKAYLGSLDASADTSGATLNVPGTTGGFPKMTAILPAELAAYTFGPETEVTKDTTFEWTSPTLTSVMTFVVASGANPNVVYAQCYTRDDGNFGFSATTKAELDAKGFMTGRLLSADKLTFKFIPQDDALLIFQSKRSATRPQ